VRRPSDCAWLRAELASNTAPDAINNDRDHMTMIQFHAVHPALKKQAR
jgi:hypothetical protein